MAQFVGLDLFSGAGGMSLGAKAAGIELIGAVEVCRHAAATYKLNFPNSGVLNSDIRGVRHWPDKPSATKCVLFGGPPCQGFSTSNQRTRNKGNSKNWLIEEFIRAVREWKPDAFVMENVKGILETDNGSFLQGAVEAFNVLGYGTTTFLLDASRYGIPQKRNRVFVVGLKGEDIVHQHLPEQPPVSVWDAIHDLPTLANGASIDELPYRQKAENSYAQALRKDGPTVTGNLVSRNAAAIIERYSHVGPGENWQSIPAHLMENYKNVLGCHTGIYRRLKPNEPSVVIGNYRKNMLIHPFENRGLSVREAARIQAIPDSFTFCGSIGFQQQQVGNMVPPPLAELVFRYAIKDL